MEVTAGGQLVSRGLSTLSEGICPRSQCLDRTGAGTVCHKVMAVVWGKQNSNSSSILSSHTLTVLTQDKATTFQASF